MKEKSKVIINYTLIGMLFGTLFPFTAFLFEIEFAGLDISIDSLKLIHFHNKLLYMIDTAPIFLGLFSFFAGVNYAKAYFLNKELKQITGELIESKKELLVITENLKIKNSELEKDLHYDYLTGLANENYLIENYKKNEKNIMIICVNISHFREINLLFGNNIGDEVLKLFSSRLIDYSFECYHSHADEFIIINYNEASYLEIDTLANYIFNLLSDEPYKVSNNEVFLTVNLGFSLYSQGENSNKTINELIHNASFALKYAKDKKLQYTLYSNDLVNALENNYSYIWKKRLIDAIKNKEIVTFFQPIINNKTLEIDKYEGLMRLKEGEEKYVSPYSFMMSSKKYGLYNGLTKIVVTNIFNEILKTEKEISINISIDDIRNLSTMKLIHKKIESIGIEKSKNIVFELLESEGIENYNEVRDFIDKVKAYKCKIAIDDFGSGYSNFSHILNLNIDYIKMDASIIKNICENKNSEFIAKLIVDFAKNSNIKTIAEFVHSKDVFEKVKEIGIDYSQGYYFSEPKLLI